MPVTMREPNMEEGQGDIEETKDGAPRDSTIPSQGKGRGSEGERTHKEAGKKQSLPWTRDSGTEISGQKPTEVLAAQRPIELRTEKRLPVLETWGLW